MPLRLEAFFKLLQLRSAKSVSFRFLLEIISEVNYWGICNNPIIILAMLCWGMLEVMHLIKNPERKNTHINESFFIQNEWSGIYVFFFSGSRPLTHNLSSKSHQMTTFLIQDEY